MKQLPELLKTSSRISLLVFSLLLSACGLDNLGDSSSQSSNSAASSTVAKSSDTVVESLFSGSVGDGPVVAATLNIYDKDGKLVKTVTSNNTAKYQAKVKARGNVYPLTIEVTGGTDLVTGRQPDFRMTSFISHPSSKNININPFSTMIVEMARSMPGGINDENISAAGVIVAEKLNFGLDPAIIGDSITTTLTDENIAVLVKASESMGEMIRRTRDQLMSIGVVASGDDVIAAIAQDITDGKLDGRGGIKASKRVAAISRLTSAQVLIETVSNNLKVDDTVATDSMDEAIIATRPSVTPSAMTGSVPVNQELLVQARDTIKLAQELSPGAGLDAIAATLDSLHAGSSAAEVGAVLPAASSEALDQPISIAVAATDEQLDAAINGDGSTIPTDPPVANRPPVLSGTPVTSVLEDAAYRYQPSASDADGDTLVFSVQNRPGWATFDTTTGRLSGTPRNTHVGTYKNIVVTVSDGSLNDSVGPFSITVKNTNDAPAISGSAPSSATAGGFYSFQPSASDPDGDDLTFSIARRPSWASFNTGTGRLSGTPDNGDAGTYSDIVITVNDGSISRSLSAFTITVSANLPANRTPVISGTPASTAAEDSAYTFQPTASDADGDSLSFSISNKPAWASFSNGTGRLSGTPGNSHVGTYSNILISVSDGKSSASVGPFTIAVTNTNDKPVISGSPATSVAEDSAYNFQPTASDADGDSLSFSISNKPAWASFNNGTGRLSGTPKNADVGSYSNIRITVSDGTTSATTGIFSISVTNTNDKPVISGSPATSVAEDSAYNFQPTASDADGDSLSFSISNKPGWASFNNGTGRLSGTPKNADVGSYSNIRITVSDGKSSASTGTFNITVNNTNDAPVISGTPGTSVDEGSSYSFTPSASDPDGDSLTFSISNKPSWASFNSGTGGLNGTPDSGDAGTYGNIRISVSDGVQTVNLAAFSVTVNSTAPGTGSASLAWDAPVARADGSPLALSEISGYTIYYGESAGSYPNSVQINDVSTTSVTITDLPFGTYYFVVTSWDTNDKESTLSDMVTAVVN